MHYFLSRRTGEGRGEGLLMCMRPMGVRMGFPLFVAMIVAVRVSLTMAMLMIFGLSCAVAAEVVMVMTMCRRRNHRIRDPALFADFCRFCRFIVVFVAPPLGMGSESFQRRLVHMA